MTDPRTAQIIQFPARGRSPLSSVADALYADICRLARASSDRLVNHSVADGMRCSGAPKHKVVKARRELQDAGLIVMVVPGDEWGPTVWQISTRSGTTGQPSKGRL